MGIVPVAPRKNKLCLEGERNRKGSREKPTERGFKRRETTYIPMFT
jgi:hypothetical protein